MELDRLVQEPGHDLHVVIGLDTFNDRRNGYIFEMNSLGTQDDAIFTDEAIQPPRRPLLHPPRHVCVYVGRERQGAVPQPLTHHLQILPRRQQQARVAVAHLVRLVVARRDSGGGQPGRILKCKGWETDPNAYIYFITQAPVWESICDVIGEPGWKTHPDYATPPARLPRLKAIFAR